MSTYLITQASGQQAQWIIKHLLAAGAKVHAVVRNPDKKPAILDSPGVTVFKGESVDFDAVLAAARGCKAAFINTFPIPGLEAQMAQTIVDACKAAGIASVVASTTMITNDRAQWDDQPTRDAALYDYWASKAAVEDVVRGAGFESYAIVRPGYISFDFYLPAALGNFPRYTQGIMDHDYDEERGRMGYTDADDIGRYVSAALLDPARFAGAEIELANEVLSIRETRDMLERVSGRKVQLVKMTPEAVEAAKAQWLGSRFHTWSNSHDLSGMPARARETQAKWGIPFTPLEEAMKRDVARIREALPA